jgi:proliferating cell nuclear antigen
MDVGSMKTAFLSLGEILVDGNITFLRDDAMPQPTKKAVKTNNSSSSRTSAGKTYKAASASEDSDSSDDESPKKPSKSKSKSKKVYKAANDSENESSDDETESDSDNEKTYKKSDKKGKKFQKNSSDDSGEDDSDIKNISKKKSNGGMVRLHEINSQRSVMVFVRLPACEFHEFFCAQKVKIISLNFQTLNRFLKRIDKDDDVMTWILRSDKPDHLIIQNRSVSNGGKFSEYEIPLIEVTKQKLDYDEATFESMVSMPSAQLQSLCKSIKDFSEYIEIKSIGKQAQFYCKGESGTIRETLGQAPKEGSGKQAVVQGIFEARYIAAASKCTPLSPKVDIFLKNDWPVVLTYTFSRKSKICFWISPVAVKPHESNNDISGDQEDLSDLSDDDNDASSKKLTEVSKKRTNHPRVSRS